MNSRSKLMTGSPTHFLAMLKVDGNHKIISTQRTDQPQRAFQIVFYQSQDWKLQFQLRNCYLSLQSNDILTICQNMSNLFLK